MSFFDPSTRRYPRRRSTTANSRRPRRLIGEHLEPRWQPASIIPGLISHWNFDEGPDWHDDAFQSISTTTLAHDSVGGNNSSLMNLTGAAFVSGQQFTALAFDGVDDYLAMQADLGGTLSGDSSIAFWIRTSQGGADSAADAPGLLGAITATGNGIQWGWLDTVGRIGVSVDGVSVAQTALPINDDRWHFLVFSRTALTGQVSIYLDGVLSGTGLGPTGQVETPLNSLAKIDVFGQEPQFLQARIDQLSLFNTVIDTDLRQQLRGNFGPKAWALSATAVSGEPANLPSVLFSSWDPEGDPLRVVRFTTPLHGSATTTGDGVFSYQSAPGYVGLDTFSVVVEDGQGGFATCEVTIDVTAPPAGSGVFTAAFSNFQAIEAAGSAISLGSWRVPRAIGRGYGFPSQRPF